MKQACSGFYTRRHFVRAGTMGLLGSLTLPRLLPAELTQNFTGDRPDASFGRAKSCILVYLLGGPPHLDMWDLKPGAPAEIRGPFRPISTSVPGTQISEHLPRLAKLADRYAIVRSVTHPNDFHTHMIYYTLTGRHMVSPNSNDNEPNPPSRSDHPHLGSLIARFKHRHPSLPGYVALPELSIRMQPVRLQGGNGGFLGPRFDPFGINEDPRNAKFLPTVDSPDEVPTGRFDRRQSLLAMIDGRGPRARPVQEYGELRDSAVRLTGSSQASGLFIVDHEPSALRERYGSHRFGQSLLLARRLVEAGVSLVAVHFNYMSKCDGWDTHSNNFNCLKDELLPLLDQGLSALIDDLDERGQLDETLVVTMGEFGRTPRINANAGRDHWGRCGSVVLAGGGVRGGQVLGSSDKTGAVPASFPVDPSDIQATMCHALGLDSGLTVVDALNRQMPLTEGKVVAQLF